MSPDLDLEERHFVFCLFVCFIYFYELEANYFTVL